MASLVPRRVTIRILLVALSCMPATERVAEAATVAYLPDDVLVRRAQRVAHGRVVDVRPELRGDGLVRTVVILRVTEDFSGVDETVLEVELPGGRHATREVVVPGAPKLEPGDEVIVCVEPARRRGRWRPVALGYSVFAVERRADGGDGWLRRLDEGIDVIGRPSTARPPGSLAEFRRLVRAARGVPSVRPRHRGVRPEEQPGRQVPMASVVSQAVSAGFTLLGGGVRWNEADAGFVLRWFRNPAAPAPVDGEDADVVIARAVGAWSGRPGTSLLLEYAGTRAIGTQSPYCSPANLGAGLISFEDPTDELGSGVLALGGGCTTIIGRRTVNGVTFESFTHAFVVLNRSDEVGPAFRTPVNFGRIVQHEIGHGIGLGHTATASPAAVTNIMYPSCCHPAMPVPPALGPDDLEGLRFIYPATASACRFEVSPTAFSISDEGGVGEIKIAASAPTCGWSAVASGAVIAWLAPTSGQGTGLVQFGVGRNPAGERRAVIDVAGARVDVVQEAGDTDADGLRDRFERACGLDPASGEGDDGPDGDPDGDGRTNLEEQAQGTHPRGFHRYWLAEGAASHFFRTEFDLVAAGSRQARAQLKVTASDPALGCRVALVVPGDRPLRVPATRCGSLSRPALTVEVSAEVESDEPLVVERTVSWPVEPIDAGESLPDRHVHGAHAEAAAHVPASAWYFAEGATHSGFDLFYLVWNLEERPVTVVARFLRVDDEPVTRYYEVPAGRRRTLWVNVEDPTLASADLAAVFVTAGGERVVVERAMYRGTGARPWLAGHGARGVTAPARHWLFAEGVTSDSFQTFLLLANPTPGDVDVAVRYLLADGTAIERRHRVPALRRSTIWVNREDPRLARAEFGVEIEVVAGGGAIVAERAVWWGGDAPQRWIEAHVGAGQTGPAKHWLTAGVETGGSRSAATYLLVLNPSVLEAILRVTARAEDGSSAAVHVTAPGRARTTLDVSDLFPSLRDRRLAVDIETVAGEGVVVERSTYWDGTAGRWVAGVSVAGSPVGSPQP